MQSDTGEVRKLYTEKLKAYGRFISFFRSRDAIKALLERSGLLHPKLRVLDAGAGFGTVTFALLDALGHRGIQPEAIEAFDLTPAMLARFQAELDSRGVTKVHLRQANVLELDQQLPSSWCNYDLIVSASMLEYVANTQLSQALSALGARLARDGTLLVIITRKNWITRALIERWWQAARYSRKELREAFSSGGFGNLIFLRFPIRYFWQNFSNHVVMAKRRENKQKRT
jgi:cyclopropane fatty-acyl-phospholipid synthase-like methyltransferase